MDQAASNPALLLSAARAGDAEARGRLFERYRSYLKLLARLELSRRLQGHGLGRGVHRGRAQRRR